MMKTFISLTKKIQINNVRKVRNGLLVETKTEDSRKKLEECPNVQTTFHTDVSKKRKPRIVIHDVPKEVDQGYLIKTIFAQNE